MPEPTASNGGDASPAILSKHAQERITEQRLALDWIEETMRTPDWTAPCPNDASLTRSYRRIAAAGGRVLRVVHRRLGGDMLVVTAFWDRDARP